ncbi:MAG: sigma factor [Planctomycetota bacterium]
MAVEPVPIADLLIHAEFVRTLARDLVRDPHSVDDLAQEAWLQTLRRPPRHGTSLRSWLAALVAFPCSPYSL